VKVISLASGSNGNCYYIEGNDSSLIVDAGISGRCADERITDFNRFLVDACGLLISHDHRDHVHAAGVFHRKFDLPLYIAPSTLRTAKRRCRLGTLGDIRPFRPGDSFEVGEFTIETIETPHDSEDSVGFVIDNGRLRVAVLTDLGDPFGKLRMLLSTLDAVIIESNYDPDMLEKSDYPAFLKRRVAGPRGHISNQQAGQLLRDCTSQRLQWACLAHLSGTNNSPELARETVANITENTIELYVATREGASPMMTVEG